MLKITIFRRTDCHFPAISGMILGPKWTEENPALNVNFSILGSVLDLVLGLVLGPVLGRVLGPVLGPVLDPVLGLVLGSVQWHLFVSAEGQYRCVQKKRSGGVLGSNQPFSPRNLESKSFSRSLD